MRSSSRLVPVVLCLAALGLPAASTPTPPPAAEPACTAYRPHPVPEHFDGCGR